MVITKITEYITDTLYAHALFSSAWSHPSVVKGNFDDDDKGMYQEIFFHELLKKSFYRTPWQLIFPKQTAGLVRKMPEPAQGMDEMHVRFYSDGIIAAELECGRNSLSHWRAPRRSSVDILEEIVSEELSYLSPSIKEGIRSQFAIRDYNCLLWEPGYPSIVPRMKRIAVIAVASSALIGGVAGYIFK